jgi:hypothetical protein
VIDPRTRTLLHEVVRRESLSLLSYIGDAFPWATTAEDAALGRLLAVVAEERAAVAELGRWLARRREPLPYIGSYPTRFTTLNFLSLGYILTRLTAEQPKAIADLERDRAAVGDAEAKAELDKLLAVKKRSRAALEALAAPHSNSQPAAAPAVHPEPATP